MWSVYRGHHHLDELKWHAKYGKIMRVAPNLVAISDVDEINQIYGIGTKFIKSPFYDLSAVYDEEGLVPDPFVIRHDKGLHSRMKRNAANAYSMNGLVQFEPWINTVMDRLVAILDRNASSGTVCDLGNLFKMFAMDAVCTLTMGRDLSYMEKGDHLGFFPTLDLFTSYMSIYMTGSDKSGTALFDLATKELERTRREPPAEDAPMTFLARLGLNQDANPKSITDREIITHAFGNLSAGSDTTAAAMRSVFYNILRSSRAYARLTKDVRENLQLPVTFTKAYAIPYLRAVIQEAMRLHPSVGQLLGRVVPPTGATIGKFYLAPGTEVGMSPWVVHRDPDIFPNPDAFIPERWLVGENGTTEAQLRRMERSFLAFGHGSHTCSGKHISIMEVTKLVGTLLLKYDMEYVKIGEGYKFVNHWFTSQTGLNVAFRHVKGSNI
ncbi:Cytochrome P450 monooxygenase andK [Colletotrichum gloeosporioides]|uniref:Cytochrome P450 monooxygenase andK n=1 Tax=Colletotrichum gloeosporioides TaxID=474922 RepID=A0A8H8WNF0_COLGL|nr:Cytochrome P450 monooxygenase andK [Colletotrichum gloeosporioides]KAF3797066.1 Cytochrome P450 monooxygenase andK [Colletotrichum gloeosporioides]